MLPYLIFMKSLEMKHTFTLASVTLVVLADVNCARLSVLAVAELDASVNFAVQPKMTAISRCKVYCWEKTDELTCL